MHWSNTEVLAKLPTETLETATKTLRGSTKKYAPVVSKGNVDDFLYWQILISTLLVIPAHFLLL